MKNKLNKIYLASLLTVILSLPVQVSADVKLTSSLSKSAGGQSVSVETEEQKQIKKLKMLVKQQENTISKQRGWLKSAKETIDKQRARINKQKLIITNKKNKIKKLRAELDQARSK